MKKIKSTLLFAATLCVFLSCSKPEVEAETCEDTHMTKVKFTNSTAEPLRVVVSMRLTPEFVPIDPLFTLNLTSGQSIDKEFVGGRYICSWYQGCATTCTRKANIFRDFQECQSYEEKQ